MALERGFDGSREIRRSTRTNVLGAGTLACPECDAPVAPDATPLSVTAPLACPFCGRDGTVRDFLSLAAPTRPAHVVVRVVAPAR